MSEYRRSVLGVFQNAEGLLLVGKRLDRGTWQFPQGGIEAGETEEEALYREMKEELGCENFSILRSVEELLRYDFPANMSAEAKKKYPHKGQVQRWFLCRFHPGAGPNLIQMKEPEFSEFQWVPPKRVLDEIVDWKKDVYIEGLAKLGVMESI